MSQERIETQHPTRSRGSVVNKAKYEQVRQSIENCLASGDMTLKELSACVIRELRDKFDGRLPWYVETVELDLEVKGVVERKIGTRPLLISLLKNDP